MQVQGGQAEKAVWDFREVAGYGCWRNSAGTLQVFMHPALYRAAANAALVASTWRQVAEIGGLLIGRVISGKSIASIIISEVQGVDSEGLLFNTTAKDLDTLGTALLDSESDSVRHSVGYFRSHLRPGTIIGPQDTQVFEQMVKSSPAVFLVLKPEGKTSCVPAFYFWEQGNLELDAARPFQSEAVPERHSRSTEAAPSETGALAVSEANNANVTQPVAGLPMATVERAVQKRDTNEPVVPVWKRPQVLAAVLFVGVWGAAFWVRPFLSDSLRGGSKSDNTNTLIGLKAERGPGGQLNLAWNRNLPNLSPTQAATLEIIDGPARRSLSIDAEQLHFGRLTYFAQSDDVQFRFEIDLGGEHSLTEGLHVVLPSDPLTADRTQETATRGLFSLPGDLSRAESGSTRSNSSESVVTTVPAVKRQIVPLVSSDGTVRTPKVLQAPPVVLPTRLVSAPTVIESGKLPDIAWDNSVPTVTLPNSFPQEDPPPSPLSVSSPSAPTAADTRPSHTVTVRSEVPPIPIRRVTPDARLFGRTFVRQETTLDVAVVVDSNGHVKSAHVVKGKSADAFLVAQSLAAARQWTFKPANDNGKNVESTFTIQFRFHP